MMENNRIEGRSSLFCSIFFRYEVCEAGTGSHALGVDGPLEMNRMEGVKGRVSTV